MYADEPLVNFFTTYKHMYMYIDYGLWYLAIEWPFLLLIITSDKFRTNLSFNWSIFIPIEACIASSISEYEIQITSNFAGTLSFILDFTFFLTFRSKFRDKLHFFVIIIIFLINQWNEQIEKFRI